MKKTNENSVKFGQRLQALRIRAKKSAAQVAHEIGVAPSTYRDWELGRAITGQPYMALSKSLNASIRDLFEEVDPQVSQLTEKLQAIEELVRELRQML